MTLSAKCKKHVEVALARRDVAAELCTAIDLGPSTFKQWCHAAYDGGDVPTGLIVVDGYQTIAGDRILCWDGNTDNGIYIASTERWTRAIDMQYPDNFPYAAVPIMYGTNWHNSIFLCTNTEPPILGVTQISFVLWIPAVTPLTNIGGGTPIWNGVNNPAKELKTLVGVTGIEVIDAGTEVHFNAQGLVRIPSVKNISMHAPLAAPIVGNDTTNIFTPLANPDVVRSLNVKFNTGWDGGNVILTGTDYYGTPIEKTFNSSNVNPQNEVEPEICFRSLTGIRKTAVGTNSATAEIRVGRQWLAHNVNAKVDVSNGSGIGGRALYYTTTVSDDNGQTEMGQVLATYKALNVNGVTANELGGVVPLRATLLDFNDFTWLNTPERRSIWIQLMPNGPVNQ